VTYGRAMAAVELDTLGEDVLRITLNRPERLNAIDGALIAGMDAALDALADPHGPFRAGILTAAGRGFCAGADLSPTGEPWIEPRASDLKFNYDMQLRLTDQMTRLYELPVPVIAAVNGVAVGGGLAYSLHCDVRVAAQEARFGSAFIKAGLSSMDMGISYLLPKVVGAGRARELMLSGRIIESDEAFRIGLVHEVVPQADLLEAALRVARSFTVNNPFGVWQT
jgi:enoyl-CoA hydratase/carnithine racemase